MNVVVSGGASGVAVPARRFDGFVLEAGGGGVDPHEAAGLPPGQIDVCNLREAVVTQHPPRWRGARSIRTRRWLESSL